MLPWAKGEPLTDEELERRLRWANIDCVEPEAIDQADLLAFSEGPVVAEVAERVKAHLEKCDYCGALSTEYRRMAVERRAGQRRRVVLVAIFGAAAAAAAAAAILIAVPRHEEVRLYALSEVRGVVATSMREPEEPSLPAEPWHFASTSKLELSFVPKVEDAPGPVPEAAVFTALPGGALSRRSDDLFDFKGDPGFRVIELTATGRELFGDEPGELKLILVLTSDRSTFAAIDGKTEEVARRSLPKNAQWLDFDVVYTVP